MASRKYSRMGRPPAKWMYGLLELNLQNDEYVDMAKIGELLDLPYVTVNAFCYRENPKSKYETINGRRSRQIQVKALKQLAKNKIEAWV